MNLPDSVIAVMTTPKGVSKRKKKQTVNAKPLCTAKVGIPKFQISLFWVEDFDCKVIIC